VPGDTDYDGPYAPGGWQNEPTETTPTSAAAFEQMVAGIKLAAQRAGVSIRFDLAQDVTGLEQAQARSNLGLGGAAILAVGTAAGTVAAGDDSRFGGGGGSVLDVFGRTSHVVAVAGDYTADMVYAAEQLDYVCDLSNTATTINTDGTQTEIAGGLGISVPPTGPNRSLIIRCGGACQVTAAGAGLIGINIYETTTGSSVQIGTSAICGAFTVGTGSAFPTFPQVSYDLGPSTVERQFKITASMIRDASSTLAAKVRSSTTGVVRAWLEGMAA
jgi:hypothetical protein